ncbi:MAG: DUF2069 domain-containing protein [Burkholderiaceae bacterium]
MPLVADNLRSVHLARAVVLAALLGLIALGLAWELRLAPTGSRSLALKVLPLAFFVTGVLQLRLASYRALSLLVWLFAAEGALRAATGSGIAVPLAWAELGLCALLFAGCVLHVRARTGAKAVAAA